MKRRSQRRAEEGALLHGEDGDVARLGDDAFGQGGRSEDSAAGREARFADDDDEGLALAGAFGYRRRDVGSARGDEGGAEIPRELEIRGQPRPVLIARAFARVDMDAFEACLELVGEAPPV